MICEREPELFDDLVFLYSVTDRQCRWPLWNGEGFEGYAVCGKPTMIGQPYCKCHCLKAYTDFGKKKEK